MKIKTHLPRLSYQLSLTLCLQLCVVGCEDEPAPAPEAGSPTAAQAAGTASGTESGTGSGTESGTGSGTESGTASGTASGTDTNAGAEAGLAVTGGEAPSACAENCAALDSCVAEACEGADRARVVELCEARCETFAPFAEIGAGIDSCVDWLSFASQQLGDEFSAQCEPGPPPAPEPLPECEPFAARLSACVTERCEPFAPIQSDAELILRDVCAQQVARGEVPLSSFATVTDDSACDQELLAIYLRFLTERDPNNPESGPFVDICAEGLEVPAETCAQACENVGPCIPEGSEGEALRDGPTCRYICAISPDVAPEVWSCLEGATGGGCLSVGQCFQ